MDELAAYGIAALAIFYVGIVIVAYGIFLVLLTLVQTFLAGNFLLFSGILAGILAAVFAYAVIGIWLRKAGVI